MSTIIKPRCELCADTGSLTTDGYLDCVACDTAAIMVALNEWLARHPKATSAEIFQHGRAVERIAADSLPKIKEGVKLPTLPAHLGSIEYYDEAEKRMRFTAGYSADQMRAYAADVAVFIESARLAAPASQAAAPADDDLLEVARCLCSMAALIAKLTPEKRKHYHHVDEEGSPLLDAARAACVARGYTEDGLAVEGVEYPAGAAPVEAASPWISVDERLPPAGELVLVFYPRRPHDWPDAVNIELDCIDPDDDDRASWLGHNQNYEHFCAVAPAGSSGPSETAPYTHWCSFPAAPAPEAQ